MKDSKIEWTHHTFNPWRGCTKVSAGCANCYADTLSKRNPRSLGVWGPNGTRVVASEAMWREPIKWDRDAAKAFVDASDHNHRFCGEADFVEKIPVRPRVFCASLADVFEDWQGPMRNSKNVVLNEAWLPRAGHDLTMNDARRRLFELIDATPNLDWLLLTKRPENIDWMMLEVDQFLYDKGPRRFRPNVWIGTSVEDQKTADERIPHLMKVPAKVRFLSMEPLLARVNLKHHLAEALYRQVKKRYPSDESLTPSHLRYNGPPSPDWIICGGESGPNARPMHPDWALWIRDQCQGAAVPFFFKQWGDWKPIREMPESEWQDLYEPVPEGQPADTVRECMVKTVMFPPEPLPKGGPCDLMFNLGKKVAGRLLGGREWNELPS